MPWKNVSTMEQKVAFIYEWQSDRYTFSELCKSFNISRKTGYQLVSRYEKEGLKGLLEKKRKPINHPNRTDEKVEEEILHLKHKHPRWGAKKIRRLLFNDFGQELIPSVVTVHNILAKNGLVIPQKRVRRVKPVYPIFDPKNCNEVWSADYKGKFKMGNNKYCHPLTIADSKSRFLFSAKGLPTENYVTAKAEFKRVFRKYGLPKQIHTDNGTPFGSVNSIQRFTRLSYWFIDLGIMPVFSDPAHPEQNGRHERMHRDLKAECTKPPGKDMMGQQRKLNTFVKEYNYVRPHEALDMETPASVHDFSGFVFPEKIHDHEYPKEMKVMNVVTSGAVRWKSYYWVYLSRGLIGKKVGFEELGNGVWRVYYRNVLLGYMSEKDMIEKEKTTRLTPNIVLP